MAEKIGTIGWLDLTVENAEQVKDFYAAVVGWTMSDVPVADYHDYCAAPPTSESPVAGICHARGENANMPAQWLMYITVDNLQNSLTECTNRGGEVVCPARDMGAYGRMAVIRDPAGAVTAIMEPPGASK